ncbi:serine hydrolase domain-containing protein [Brevundimonas sp. UBA2416]|uniref:serine hydrolase domain-containing protein n=1 Tax=Brevundimonas sp. UBA2416 TaxID=1946124 RepID=UPI0025BD6B03|nr:serine hydrolase domain-containing protein [Brevundimonas sp. UBA2416]HRJ64093.1 serine hydrolase domain-containing protein [Brevundimonas sp.]
MKVRSWAAAALVALAVFATDVCRAQPATPQSLSELDTAVAEVLADARVPGAALIVIENGRVVFRRNYGVADRATQAPVVDGTVFRAGSISKSFTAIGVMTLVEEGRLSLDAEVADLLPDLSIRNPWRGTDPVRLVHLLEHTAGLDDIAFRHYWLEGRDVPLSDAVGLYGPYQSRWRPGTRTSYSNAGPIMAGRVIETVSGERFQDFMARRLTTPMGMTSASWTLTPEMAVRLSRSYRAGDLTEERFMDIPGRPSGSLNLTASDLARLPLLMLGRGTLDGVTYFSPATARRIETPAGSNAARAGLDYGYALGNVADTQGRVVFHGHDGSIDGFVATYAYAPQIGAAYVLMANSPAGEVLDAAGLVRRYLERQVAPPVVVAQPISERNRRAWAGQYQTMTPRRRLLAALVGLTQWEGASFESDALLFKGRRWLHVGEGLFQAEGDAAPGLAIIETSTGVRIQSGIGAHRRVPGPEMSAKIASVALFTFGLLSALAYACLWALSALMGRLKSRGGLALRLLPFLAILFSAAAALAPLALLATDDLTVLGRPSVAGWSIFAISLAAPILAVVALAKGVTPPGDANRVSRIFAVSCALLACAACLYLAFHGWIGLRIWNA